MTNGMTKWRIDYMSTIEIKNNITDLTDAELLTELNYANKMSKFYYARKEEIMKEVERRAENGNRI